LRDNIDSFKPNKAFLHFLPNDILGFCTFSNTVDFEKYYIVHNDHTFWLGKACSDRFIFFRELGVSFSLEKRNIPNHKILYLPFYPVNDKTPFQGFPFDRTNKIIGFSAGASYKYLSDDKLDYLVAIKDLLSAHPNFIFCLCSFGNSSKIKSFIVDNNLQDRFYLLGQRTDFYSLIGNCDILFESYPLKGGLTPLFAIEQDIPVLGIANFKNWSGSLEQILGISGYTQPQSIREFKIEAKKLIKNITEREKLAVILKKNKLNKVDFYKGLKDIFNNNYENLTVKVSNKFELDNEEILLSYLNLAENLKYDLLTIKFITLKNTLSMFEKIILIFRITLYKVIILCLTFFKKLIR
jgi:glycosyltransferase involved in cell wall biosynthesis